MAAYVVAITGASGSIYAKTMLEALISNGYNVHLIISEPGILVLKDELNWELSGTSQEIEAQLKKLLDINETSEQLRYYDSRNLAATIASGSVKTKGMIVIPCTMSTIAGISNGSSKNLIERAADVTLKEKRPLILVPRETPLSQIHLSNMLNLSRMGVHIVPAMPAFYNKPVSIQDLANFIVGRIFDLIEIEIDLYPRWQG